MTKKIASPSDAERPIRLPIARALFEESPDGMLLIKERRIVQCNRAAAHLFGYPSESALHERLLEGLCPSEQPDGTDSILSIQTRFRAALEDGPQRFEWVHQRADGSDFWVEVLLTTLDVDGEHLCHAALRDISARKEMERRLELSARVFTSTQDGILITDAETRILRVNDSFTRITGFRPEEVVGQTPRILQSGHHDAAFYQAMWSAITTEGCWSGEVWDRSKHGMLQPNWTTISRVDDPFGRVSHFIAVFSDLTEIKRSQERLQHQAYHDTLTGLPNRLLFKDRLGRALRRSRQQNHQVAVLFIDLDHFKDVNDSFGHTAGDQILQQVAQRLRRQVEENDTLARLGGDEFSICIAAVKDSREAFVRAEAIHELLAHPFQHDGQSFHCHCSIGISLYPHHGSDAEELVRSADSALHSAKELGRNNSCFYAEELTQRAQRRLSMAQEIRLGLEGDAFQPFFQRQVDMATGETLGLEALVRWHHPRNGLIPPGDFIPVAEEVGLIARLGERVLYDACRQARAWLDAGYRFERVAVNISAAQLHDGRFHETVDAILKQSGLAAERLELEITESAFMTLDPKNLQSLCTLRERGIRLAIDDFGTGYSSLLYLKRLPIDRLKIDKGFIWDMGSSPESRSIVQTIVELAAILKLDVVAEGVETEAQRRQVVATGCKIGQGYLWGRPEPNPLRPNPPLIPASDEA